MRLTVQDRGRRRGKPQVAPLPQGLDPRLHRRHAMERRPPQRGCDRLSRRNPPHSGRRLSEPRDPFLSEEGVPPRSDAGVSATLRWWSGDDVGGTGSARCQAPAMVAALASAVRDRRRRLRIARHHRILPLQLGNRRPGGASRGALLRTVVRVDATTVAYRRWGDTGSPIVLLGGFAEPSWVWHEVGPLLGRNHRVVAIDLPPFGYTQRSATRRSCSGWPWSRRLPTGSGSVTRWWWDIRSVPRSPPGSRFTTHRRCRGSCCSTAMRFAAEAEEACSTHC